ncbi:MAG TPA: hypothetical protein VEC35_06930 [Noviherbaspirillum sp.]|nr:hypothetical protein [Noviherbaspirillum sp.]
MEHRIFDKTDKGREEIATRKYHLPSRLRPLLVMIDGKQPAGELLKKVAGLGLNADSLNELLDNEFIRVVEDVEAVQAAPVAPPVTTGNEVEDTVAADLLDGTNQFQAIYQFYTETIKSTIGLRGYALQLKVEKAASIDDFRALRDPYLEAVLKAKGREMARSLRGRLDQLLYIGQTVPNTTVIGLNVAASE